MIVNFYDTIIVASLVKQWQYSPFKSIAVRKVLETVASLLKLFNHLINQMWYTPLPSHQVSEESAEENDQVSHRSQIR